MSTQVFKVKRTEIETFRDLIFKENDVEVLKTTNPYEVFRVKYQNFMLIGYVSGKIVGNNESSKPLVAKILGKMKQAKFDVVIGSDEAGKGEWLGPMIIAAVALSPKGTIDLQIEGIMDSKEIGIERMIDLSKKIKEGSLAHHLVTISPERFNELFKEVKDEGKSLNDLLAWGHAKAIDEVYKKVWSNKRKVKIVIDEFDRLKTEKRLKRVLNLKDIVVEQRPGAEEEVAVAAASILARAEREARLDRESRRLGIDLRGLTPQEALSMENVHEFAKLSYLTKKRFHARERGLSHG